MLVSLIFFSSFKRRERESFRWVYYTLYFSFSTYGADTSYCLCWGVALDFSSLLSDYEPNYVRKKLWFNIAIVVHLNFFTFLKYTSLFSQSDQFSTAFFRMHFYRRSLLVALSYKRAPFASFHSYTCFHLLLHILWNVKHWVTLFEPLSQRVEKSRFRLAC